ncbi:two-partner secretion domain-containing protein [Kamptonema formosum]|uniref:two-partner secretion domain-containing protein n=1 Tax=Kamptonema formosum TaxID=331992 RepID=UPI000348BAB4|nr:filamentous hemagglutinin N-terminal domain-containing protein [Oscillatoria sp. PCC 10802]
MTLDIRNLWIFGSLAIASLVTSSPSWAQIAPDATLPVSSAVTPQGHTLNITGGTRAGGNLFHSFREFSLPAGTTAHFNNSLNIQNIISRVTGGTISNIDGTIKANGTANLFLLNPSGIVFGPNATLNIGGSFLASTASSIKFADGIEFSATNPAAPPLLTVNVPVGLQLGQNPGKIVVRGAGHNVTIDLDNFQIEVADLYILRDRPPGLQVSAGKTLALVGGEIALNGGNLTAPDGRIELGSLAAGEVSIATDTSVLALQYPVGQTFSDTRLTSAASASTSGEGGGSIQVRSRQLSLRDGSGIFGLTFGGKAGGNIDIRTADSVEMGGSSPAGLYTLIVTEAYPGSTGKAGNITVETGRLLLQQGALISSSTFGAGDGGSVTVRASLSAELSGVDASGLGSFLTASTPAGSRGNAGNLTIETGTLTVRDGALISSATGGAGQGGVLTVRATEFVELSGADGSGTGSRLQTQARPGSTGNAGNLTVETGRLILQDGGLVSAGSAGTGSAGTLTVKARDFIQLTGTSRNGKTPSTISTSVESAAASSGGDITLETSRLILRGGLISTSTTGAAHAGNLTVNSAGSVELTGTGRFVEGFAQLADFTTGLSDLRNGLYAMSFGSGDAGNITINTSRFTVENGAFAVTSTTGAGLGGALTVNAKESAHLDNSGLITGNRPASTGVAGNLTINTRNLRLQNSAVALTSTAGAGASGTLTVNATDSIELIGGDIFYILGIPLNTSLTTTTISPANAGDIKINTGRLAVSEGARVSASTYSSGRSGTVHLTATDSVTVTGTSADPRFPSFIRTNSSGSGDAGDINIATPRLIVGNGARIAVDSFAGGKAGNLEIAAPSVRLFNFGTLSAQTAAGDRGNITLTTGDIQLRQNSAITTSATGTATGGNIAITADTITALENSDITANAQQGSGGQVSISAKGIFGTEYRQMESPLTSDITASSLLGASFSGVVRISAPDANPAVGLVQLHPELLNASNLIDTGCAAFRNSSFTVTGRGGIPPSPSEPLAGETVLIDFGSPPLPSQPSEPQTLPKSPNPASPSPLVEARGWIISPQGTVTLTANPPNGTPHGTFQPLTPCPQSR